MQLSQTPIAAPKYTCHSLTLYCTGCVHSHVDSHTHFHWGKVAQSEPEWSEAVTPRLHCKSKEREDKESLRTDISQHQFHSNRLAELRKLVNRRLLPSVVALAFTAPENWLASTVTARIRLYLQDKQRSL